MTRKEAIEFIKNIIGEESGRSIGKEGFYAELIGYHIEALKMAIQALSQEPISVSVSEKEPDEISEEVTLRFFKDTLKVRWHDFVIYNVEWLKKNWQMEMDIVCGVKPCDDAISRDAVIELIERGVGNKSVTIDGFTFGKSLMLYHVKQLPSVTQKSGKWIEHPEIETSTPEYLMFYECSECGDKQCFYKSDIHKKRFCTNCGAKMVEPQESEEISKRNMKMWEEIFKAKRSDEE